MDDKYFMGKGDFINRIESKLYKETYVSPDLKERLLKFSIKETIKFYSIFFNKDIVEFNIDNLINEYVIHYNKAIGLGLFQVGGIREKDHLNFWCLNKVFSPQLYIESGVYIGSSLHAYIQDNKDLSVIAIDPDLSQLKINDADLPNNIQLIDNKDFSELELKEVPHNTLVYFDDHINSANRIIQSYNKGIKYLLFDDSTGLEGVCQRLYPAFPTVPIILNYELFNEGDKLVWSWEKPIKNKQKSKNPFKKNIVNQEYIALELTFNPSLLELCSIAKDMIKRCVKIPDLGDYLPQRKPEKFVDLSKYLIELK